MTGKRSAAQSGLTLFELLVVLAILAFLAAIVAPRVIGYLGRAKSDVAETQAANLVSSLELFFLDLGRYPTPEEGLVALVEAPSDLEAWRGPYLKDRSGLIDPWGRAYVYEVNNDAEVATVLSHGRDGVPGGAGEDADIIKR